VTPAPTNIEEYKALKAEVTAEAKALDDAPDDLPEEE